MRTEPNDYKDIHEFLDEHGEELDQGIIHEEDISTIFDFLLESATSELRAVKSKLILLFQHMLKYQYQQQKRSSSWIKTIREARRFIDFARKDSKSLGNKLTPELINICYKNAREYASDETGLSIKTFPEQCPYDIDYTLDRESGEQFLKDFAYSKDATRYLGL